ncbi:MAG TPA: acetate--CoA ligase family protein, partial [Gaiellales bacterium]|nr:acetate--CoA ligase family protein [Gaiellales bacterium]
DLAGGGEQDFYSYARTARALLCSGEVDVLVMTGYFGGYSRYSEDFQDNESDVARQIVQAVAESGRPLVAQSMYWDAPPSQVLRAGGVPVYATIEAAAAAAAALSDPAPAEGAPPVPDARTGQLGGGYFGARSLLAEAGVPFVPAERVTDAAGARAAAERIGYPVVVKALGSLHKSDAGGVVVGIADPFALDAAVAGLIARLAPPELSVERLAPLADGVELILGCRRDARFGPVAMIGLGGVFAELLHDVAVGLAPLDQARAERLLRSLHGAPMLEGARGRPPVDLAAAARAAVALSVVAAARADIEEIEVNPLLVTPDGALALDARVIPVAADVEVAHAG